VSVGGPGTVMPMPNRSTPGRARPRLPKAACGAALAIALATALATALAPNAAPATILASAPGATFTSESGNPIEDQGSSYDYRSNITSITPDVPGLSVEVLEFADRLLLRNHTGKTVTIYGYDGEPYARVLANGTAEQNTRSPATYLNTNFYAQVKVPAFADPTAPPRWEVIDRTSQFEWHDHRIHWMSPIPPAKVRDQSKRTWIFDWEVPIAVGGRRGAIDGDLYWTPDDSSAPTAVIALGVAIAIAGLLFALLVRRRRARTGRTGGGGAAPGGTGARRGSSGPGAAGSGEVW
jgi:hypothetical protein